MAGIPSEQLIPLGNFPAGIDNRSREDAVPRGEGGANVALREAVNVDIDNAGKVSRRPGFTQVEALTDLHSLYASDRFPFMLAMHGSNLVKFDSSLTRSTVQASIGQPLNTMSFDVAAGVAFYSNRYESGRIDDAGTRKPWAVETPGGPPIVTANSSAGGLRAGTYLLCITYFDDAGWESGASLATEITLTEGQGINLTFIPQPVAGDVDTVRVYLTPPGGEVFYMAADIPVGIASYLIGAHVPGRALDTLHLEPLPAGQIVRAGNGRLHVATGNVHYWSEAMHYGLGKRHDNYARYDGDITLMEFAGQAEGSGLYVAAGKRTYYLSGPDPKNWQRVIAHAHGAVPGTATQVEASRFGIEAGGLLPCWLNTEGQLVIGAPGGQVIPLHRDRYSAPANAEFGSMAMRDFRGVQHLIAALRGGSTSGVTATDVAEAEVWRNGVRVS